MKKRGRKLGTKASLASRAKMSATMKRKYAEDPSYRKRVSQGVLEALAEKRLNNES